MPAGLICNLCCVCLRGEVCVNATVEVPLSLKLADQSLSAATFDPHTHSTTLHKPQARHKRPRAQAMSSGSDDGSALLPGAGAAQVRW